MCGNSSCRIRSWILLVNASRHAGSESGTVVKINEETSDVQRFDRFLASPGLSESTRRAYASDLADFGGWLERTADATQ